MPRPRKTAVPKPAVEAPESPSAAPVALDADQGQDQAPQEPLAGENVDLPFSPEGLKYLAPLMANGDPVVYVGPHPTNRKLILVRGSAHAVRPGAAEVRRTRLATTEEQDRHAARYAKLTDASRGRDGHSAAAR